MDYGRIKKLFDNGKLTSTGLDKAVHFGWITDEEKQQIMEGNDENS